MRTITSRILILALGLLASCGDDPTAPVIVENSIYELLEINGQQLPVHVASYEGEELCEEEIYGGVLWFLEGDFRLSIQAAVDCSGGAEFQSGETIRGSYEQQGARIDLMPLFGSIIDVQSATLRGDRLVVTAEGTQIGAMSMEFRFREAIATADE